jgi:hypothetical protein
MSLNHPFAARAIDIIRSLSSKWTIALPEAAAAVANYRVAGGRRSPIQTSFFAASIPRKQSSEGRKQSATSIGSTQSSKMSPFSPPSAAPPRQQQQLQQHHRLDHPPSSTPDAVFSDPGAPLDPRHGNFWTPFPTQVMPMPQHTDGNPAFDFMNMGGPQQWQSYGGQSHQVHDYKAGPPSGRIDEAISGSEQWHWE